MIHPMILRNRLCPRRASAILITLCLSPVLSAENVPDFTKGEPLVSANKNLKFGERAMGPTGLWGQVYSQSMEKGASRDARQFRVTRVEPGSPADGVIRIGDVVVGTHGRDFDSDARKQLATAIAAAEETDGKLPLRVWRDGDISTKTLQLRVMGKFDPSNLLSCAHTDAVIDHMAAHALKHIKLPPEKRASEHDVEPFMPSMVALGMLATGKQEFQPKIRAYAQWLSRDEKTGGPVTFDVSSDGKRVWNTSYNLIFLAEYFLSTGDASVLPAIETLGVGAAKGQSWVGSYGHRFASRTPDGGYNGTLVGYGAINNASLSMWCGMVLASKCGVEDPFLTKAIARSKRFFDFYIGHGGIPYGDHWAGTDYFENNGTSGLTAIAYSLMGEPRGQRFFSAMAVAAAPTGREEGHQGCYWSYLWSDLGAARAGAAGLNASFLETRYLRTLERGWDGRVIDPSNIGPTKYSKGRGDVTGERLLLMSLGRKNVHFTGKEMEVEKPLQGQALADALEAGRLIYHPEARKSLSEETIFRLLRHELPAARITAAKAMQEQNLDRVDRLIEMINDPDPHARYGACNALALTGRNSQRAVEALVERMLKDDDILFRYFAIDALSSGKGNDNGLHGAAAMAMPALYQLASGPVPHDPRGHLAWRIAEALFYHKYALFDAHPPKTAADEEAMIRCIRHILLNENGRARSSIPLEALNEKQLASLWDGIHQATRDNAPSGIMFSKGIRMSGMAVMAKHRIKEGLDLMLELSKERIELTEENKWLPWFAETLVAVLPYYGRDALPVIEVVEQWPVLEGRGKKIAEQLPALKEEIRNAPKVKLVSYRR